MRAEDHPTPTRPSYGFPDMRFPEIRAKAKRVGEGARGLGVSAGLLPYRPVARIDAGAWNTGYATGEWNRMADVGEAGRYAVLLGYLRLAAGEPAILDVGCGVGLFRGLLDQVPFRRYVGVDVSSAAIEQALVHKYDRTEFIAVEVTDIESAAFDIVLCNEMLYYVDDPSEFLTSVRRVLRPGGHLLTSIWRHPGDRHLHSLLDSAFDLIDRVELRNSSSRRLRWNIAWHRRGDGAPTSR